MFYVFILYIFFFKQKTAYEMRISDWSSDVCSSDLINCPRHRHANKKNDADDADDNIRHEKLPCRLRLQEFRHEKLIQLLDWRGECGKSAQSARTNEEPPPARIKFDAE